MITVKFTCPVCKLEDQLVPVPARKKPRRPEDEEYTRLELKKWMEVVASRVHVQHSMSSPNCPNRKVDLKIPADTQDKDYWVGKQCEWTDVSELPSV